MKKINKYFITKEEAFEAYAYYKKREIQYSATEPRFSKSEEIWYLQLTIWSLD